MSVLHQRSPLPKPPAAKRVFDLVIATAGIVCALPLFAIIALLIKLDSRGPVFFRQARVGLNRRRFQMWKFRKMPVDLRVQGPSLTGRYDVRLTRVGRILERTKLDELPQLLNVLSGDMSIVGPRPEVPKFVDAQSELWDEVLSVKPGVLGPNQLRNRNESDLYPPGCKDVEAFYRAFILPEKLQVDAEYARTASLGRDARLVFACVVYTLFGAITRQSIQNKRWFLANLVVLVTAATVSSVLALAATRSLASTPTTWAIVLTTLATRLVALIAFRIPQTVVPSATAQDFLQLVRCAVVASTLTFFGLLAFGINTPSILLCDLAVFTTLLFVYKLLLYKGYLTFRVNVHSREHSRRVILTTILITPLTVAAAAWSIQAAGARMSFQRMYNLEFIACATFFRALALLTQPIYYKPSSLEYLLTQGPKILLAAMAGSCLTQFACVLLDNPLPAWHGVTLELGLFTVATTAIGIAMNRHRATNGTGPANREDRSRPTLLLVGCGLELSAYISALSALQDHEVVIAGVVTPHGHHRHGRAGGYPIIGELHDIPTILELLPSAKVVVICSASFPDLPSAAPIQALKPEQVFIVDHLLPITDATALANGPDFDELADPIVDRASISNPGVTLT